ncbi:MAG TPA: hypothetical protein VMG40_09645 [Bryobacteraceae bacterium]|nr:hypothetical protein [Bryobacteraceae bacterium]
MTELRCGECSWPVPLEAWNRDGAVRCPVCGASILMAVFPAIGRKRAGAQPEAVIADSEASCFYHPASRAVVPCDECGRFLCSLCEIEIDSRRLCPKCFEAGVASNRLQAAETRRTMYDTIALSLATFPALLFWPAIVGAPAALYTIVRRWRTPLSIVPRTRVRYYLAALLALAEIAGAVLLIGAIMRLPRPA